MGTQSYGEINADRLRQIRPMSNEEIQIRMGSRKLDVFELQLIARVRRILAGRRAKRAGACPECGREMA